MTIFDNCLTLKSKLHGYIDVDWVSNISNKKSTSDIMFSFGSGVVSWSNPIYNYNSVCPCVCPSDATVPRFNDPAEPARTVGSQKREPARTVGFRKREPRSWWLMRRVVREDQETEISRQVSTATEQIRPRDGNLEASFRCYWTNPTTRRKSRGEFPLLFNKSHHDFLVDFFGGWNSPLLNKSNHDFLVDFFGGCHSQDHWELQKLKRKLLSWSTNCCKNSKESISFLKKLRGSISGSAIAAAETKRIIDLRISHRCCRN